MSQSSPATVPLAEESDADFRKWVRGALKNVVDAQLEEKKMLRHIRKLLQYHGVTLEYLVRARETDELDEVSHG